MIWDLFYLQQGWGSMIDSTLDGTEQFITLILPGRDE